MNKDAKLSIRISTGDLEQIKGRAKQARMSQSDYVTHCCLGRQVVVIEDLKEVANGNRLGRRTGGVFRLAGPASSWPRSSLGGCSCRWAWRCCWGCY